MGGLCARSGRFPAGESSMGFASPTHPTAAWSSGWRRARAAIGRRASCAGSSACSRRAAALPPGGVDRDDEMVAQIRPVAEHRELGDVARPLPSGHCAAARGPPRISPCPNGSWPGTMTPRRPPSGSARFRCRRPGSRQSRSTPARGWRVRPRSCGGPCGRAGIRGDVPARPVKEQVKYRKIPPGRHPVVRHETRTAAAHRVIHGQKNTDRE